MAFIPRDLEALPPESSHRRTTDPPYDDPEDHTPEWQRKVRRIMLDSKEVRDHCRRQLEMIAARREFLKSLNTTDNLAHDKGPAAEGAALRPKENVSARE